MEENALAFNEGQLKRVGFADAFTPELKSKMEEGMPVIQQAFTRKYDGDNVNAILYLKKSATSDHYFLNKFDLELQKEGQASAIKQTFYLTKKISEEQNGNNQKQRLENKYTLKEAYNLLSGRPVFKNLVSNEGKEYQAWVKLNFKNKLENGNHELKQYTEAYGFNLENVLKNYPIKELMNPEYKQSLMDSLHRGNLQTVTFVGNDGKEEKLFISPHISFGALNVYDLNKQRLMTEQLVEKQYIGKEFLGQLKQNVSQHQKQQQKQELPTQKEGQRINQRPEGEETPKQNQRQKVNHSEKPKPKQSRKQKVH